MSDNKRGRLTDRELAAIRDRSQAAWNRLVEQDEKQVQAEFDAELDRLIGPDCRDGDSR